jgi:hypothetical protein
VAFCALRLTDPSVAPGLESEQTAGLYALIDPSSGQSQMLLDFVDRPRPTSFGEQPTAELDASEPRSNERINRCKLLHQGLIL